MCQDVIEKFTTSKKMPPAAKTCNKRHLATMDFIYTSYISAPIPAAS